MVINSVQEHVKLNLSDFLLVTSHWNIHDASVGTLYKPLRKANMPEGHVINYLPLVPHIFVGELAQHWFE